MSNNRLLTQLKTARPAVIIPMKRLFIVSLILAGCEVNDVHFKYRPANPSGILIENYEPVTIDQLNSYLIKVNDTLKMDSINIFITGETIERINPDFDRAHFIKWFYQQAGDTTNLPNDIQFGFGTFKGQKFIVNDLWDEKLLKSRFLKND